ncbi:MAG: hypothetical protein GEV12_09355 [Micromonosporaceae bacterium]|nr:hypothetical protein [Micromonosporaceae bacterium]
MTTPTTPTRPRVLDAAALLAEARGETYVMAAINVVLRSGGELIVPAGAISAAIATRPAAEPRLLALIERDQVHVDNLTGATARRVGRLLARSKLPIELLPAAHVVHAATDRDRCPVFTGDPAILRQVDPNLTLDEI